MSKTAIFSFFSGSGLLDLGFEKCGYEVVFVNEYHKPFLEAYKYSRKKLSINIPDESYQLRSIDDFLSSPGNLELSNAVSHQRNQGNVVGFIGGPPCPDFSVGGKNKGKHGENGRLSQSYIEVICHQQPDFFLFENVKGLWRTKKHREFYDFIKSKLHENGYVTTDRLTNSIEFGAPQDRDRILMFGIKRELVNANSTTKTTSDGNVLDGFNWDRYLRYSRDSVFSMKWPQTTEFIEDAETENTWGVPLELTVQYWFDKNSVCTHPNAGNFFKPKAALSKFEVIPEGDSSKKSFKRLHRWRYSPTAAYGNNEVHLHPYKARRLTVAEALAIQSLPREFELPPKMTLTDMFKTIGNGVPYMMSEGIAKTIRDFLIENCGNALNLSTDDFKS